MILSPFNPDHLAPVAALIPPRIPEPPVPAALRAPVPAPAAEDLTLSADEAGAMLPAGDIIHVVGPIRDRWSRQRTREVLRTAQRIRLSLATRAVGFGLSVDRRGAESLLIETDRAEVARWLAAQADRLAKE